MLQSQAAMRSRGEALPLTADIKSICRKAMKAKTSSNSNAGHNAKKTDPANAARNEETQPDFLPDLKRQYKLGQQQQN